MQKATDFLSNNNNQLEDIMEQKTLFAAKQNKTLKKKQLLTITTRLYVNCPLLPHVSCLIILVFIEVQFT